MSTVERRWVPGPAGPGGYRPLVCAPGEPYQLRQDLGPVDLSGAARPLVAFAHLSDTHVMDHQSPGRVELLDRYADPDLAVGVIVGTYRPQELFTAQVVEAMVAAVQAHPEGPWTGAPLQFAVVTGDATDNCQHNELETFLTLLDGGVVTPDSGDLSRYEGVASPAVEDERYWHPDGGIPDLPRTRFGLPAVAGVLDAARAPFTAAGLGLPWISVHGNHDAMLQGTVPPDGMLAGLMTGPDKLVTPPAGMDPQPVLSGLDACDTSALDLLATGVALRVTPDRGRRPVDRDGHLRAHLARGGKGYSADNLAAGTTYQAFDAGGVRAVVLDTVNQHGGWQGSLDREQLAWLETELASSADRPVVLFSHHPLETLVNGRHPAGTASPVLTAELRSVLLAHPCVVAWVNGHTHEHTVRAVTGPGARGFWQVTTASHLDWPQQSRIVEIAAVPGGLVIAATIVDTAAGGASAAVAGSAEVCDLAGLSRELAANDWQVRDRITADGGVGAGRARDRNVVLTVPWP